MAASPSPEGENASISDESDGGGKSGEICGNVAENAVEERRPEGRNIGENYETTADIDLQLLEELGMIVDPKFIVLGFCVISSHVCWVVVVEGQYYAARIPKR
jgi:hypothetical protein